MEQGRECEGQSRGSSHPAGGGGGDGAEAKPGAWPWAAQQDLGGDAGLWPGGAGDSPPVCAQKKSMTSLFAGRRRQRETWEGSSVESKEEK